MNIKKLNSSNGFTIVELMISLSILSVILVISTVVITQIGRIYAKGVNAADIQNINRNVLADLSSSLQFSGSQPFPCTIDTAQTCAASTASFTGIPTAYAYCIGTTRYSFVFNKELGYDQSTNETTNHVLWKDTMSNISTCIPVDLSVAGDPSPGTKGYEMVGPHMQITKLKIKGSSTNIGEYTVDAWLGYGDSDLVRVDVNGVPSCKDGDGTEFCASSQLSQTVIRRLD
ncbi:MAG: prepilin-type N-terminal cleavage/methylation domain-containing protein [Patescibacteria group bacterium]|nr:prepilin-type N-terminal cleavage/methylation domain-containing protein [Patescibacteria group bacterium]